MTLQCTTAVVDLLYYTTCIYKYKIRVYPEFFTHHIRTPFRPSGSTFLAIVTPSSKNMAREISELESNFRMMDHLVWPLSHFPFICSLMHSSTLRCRSCSFRCLLVSELLLRPFTFYQNSQPLHGSNFFY